MLNLFKSRLFLAGQGLVALIVLVVVLGRIFHWSTTVQLIAIMAILVLGMVMLIVGYVRANKSASAIQGSIRSQAENQRMSVRPDNQAEIEQLQKDLEDAIERLKHSKLGGGRSGKRALYALPWYMIIGPPAAGKTTAIANSGLTFPIGMDAFRGVGGTRNCDWFFSDSAIFLDTAGRYMTEQEDTEEWNTFLQTLKENRRRQPVNGVLVAISIAELADATPDQIEWHASTIRRRIDDLVARLDVTFPVYLIFTKCDLLRGFTQFFGALSRKEREQILGCTLQRNWEADSGLRELFEREFNSIAGALLNWRNEGLGLAMKRAERHLVYVFPLEFASVKEKLTQFVSMLFQPNPYRDTPAFRGFYFTSGTQEGLPIDRVIRAIADRFGFEPAAFEESEQATETKAYFIKDIFEEVIIPDRYLVSRTSRAAVRKRALKSGIAAGALILLVFFVIGSTQAVVRSSTRLGDVREASVAVSQVEITSSDLTEDDLDALESLRALIGGLETPAVFGWGLDRGSNVLDPAKSLLLDKMRDLVDARLFPRLRNRIVTTIAQRIDATGKDSLEEDTKAFLLLTSYTAVLDTVDGTADFLKHRLRSISAEIPSLSDERLEALLGSFVDGIRDRVVDGFSLDRDLLERATRILREPVNATRLYDKLRRDSEEALGFYSLEEMLPAKARYFESNPTIPKFFTQAEWTSFVEEKISEYSATPVRDAWVPWAVDAPEVDPAEFEEQLTSRYLEDYKNEWDRFLRSVRIKRFRDIREAASSMARLADLDESPILWLLSRVSHETLFPSSTLAAAQDLAGADREPRNVVERYFRSLHRLNVTGAQSGETNPSLIQALNSLRSVADDMDSMVGDGAGSADYAARVLRDQGGVLESARRDVQLALTGQSSAVRDNLFERPIVLSWAAVLTSVQSYLDSIWKDEVYDPYRERLEGKYPLSDGEDAPIRDFEDFFRPNGDVSTFVADELARFLQDNRFQARRWQGFGINLSASTRTALERIQSLQETLYVGDNLRWEFVLAPDLPEKPVSVRALSYYLDIHGISQLYQMTPPVDLSITWPRDPDVTLRVSLTDAELPPRQYRGDWAVFKFLRDAEVVRKSSTEYDLKWDMTRNVKAVYHATVQSSRNPFNDPDIFNIVIPSSLGN